METGAYTGFQSEGGIYRTRPIALPPFTALVKSVITNWYIFVVRELCFDLLKSAVIMTLKSLLHADLHFNKVNRWLRFENLIFILNKKALCGLKMNGLPIVLSRGGGADLLPAGGNRLIPRGGGVYLSVKCKALLGLN